MVKSDRMAYSEVILSVQVFTMGRERSGLLNKVSKDCCLVSQVVSNSFATPWTVAHQAPLSMGFSRQAYWSGLPLPPPEDLPNPGTEPLPPASVGRIFTTEPPGKTSRD